MTKTVLLVVSPEEKDKYLHRMANALAGAKVKVYSGEITTATYLQQIAQKLGADGIITTRQDYVEKLVPHKRKKPNLKNYAGSLFPGEHCPVLVVYPIRSTYVLTYGEWMMERLCTKITKPERWHKASTFTWTWVKDSASHQEFIQSLDLAVLAAVDIETVRGELPTIESISFTLLMPDRKTKTFAWYIESMEDVSRMRIGCGHKVPKVLQNGKYDAAYLFAWSSPLVGYYHDTVNAMHSWYAELPKDLAFITSLFVRESQYWKDLHEIGDRVERLEYNARDTWGTLESYLAWVMEAPEWAKNNYIHEFSLVPIFHAMEMRGLKRDQEILELRNKELTESTLAAYNSLQKMLGLNPMGAQQFNPGSPKQMLQLMEVLGAKNPESTDEKNLKALQIQHPLNERILEQVLDYRGKAKLLSTYLPIGDKSKEFKGQILGSFNPHGTDTGRKSSKEHHFWCGLQFQNIPDGPVKETLKFPTGYLGYEFDFSQAEARGVAYSSGDEALIEAVESGNDFHSWNASMFFGIPYEEIYQNPREEFWDSESGKLIAASAGKTLNKALRNLAKRVNHGANYNMGPAVMLDTMGIPAVREAQRLLELPPEWGLIQVTTHLLHIYETTYPKVKGIYYTRIKHDVKKSKLLVGATGWTRYCFGDPSKNKLDLNSYVAHVTQSLNAMVLDIAHKRIEQKYPVTAHDPIVLHFAQIHDSLLLGIREDVHEEVSEDIRTLMTFPVPVTDCTGITRNMVVPVDKKLLGTHWQEAK